ncbi:MAG TPA: transporter [Povalibacter sp.]|nr:transporter [Povalibacter sp.]
MNASRYIACLAATLLSTAAARAADSDDELRATPYRPTVSNPAALPVPHHFEWEAGGYVGRDPGDTRHISIPYLVKYAFSDDVGMLVGGESFIVDRGDGDTTSGWGNTSVTMKFHHALSESTGIGLEAGVALPTASRHLGSGHTDYTLNGIVSTEAAGCDVDINVSYTRLGIADSGTSRDVVGWAVAASHDLAGKWGLAGEFSGIDQRGTNGTAQFLGALSFTATPTLVFDGGALFGLNRESTRYGVFAGVTMLVR